MPVVMMHFSYFDCVTTLHRVSIHHGPWMDSHAKQIGTMLHDEQLNPRVYDSQSICLNAARNSIRLLEHIDFSGDSPRDNFIWFVGFSFYSRHSFTKDSVNLFILSTYSLMTSIHLTTYKLTAAE